MYELNVNTMPTSALIFESIINIVSSISDICAFVACTKRIYGCDMFNKFVNVCAYIVNKNICLF